MSVIVMTCSQVAALPQASVAVKVRVMVCVQPSSWTSVSTVTSGLGSQSSVAPGTSKSGTASHSYVTSGGHSAITGGVRSTTVIVCSQVATLPQASVAV